MLKITNLQVSLAEEKKEILKGIDLHINQGEIHVLSGRNGSGKSTLVNTIMGNPAFEIKGGEISIEQETFEKEIFEEFDSENYKDFVHFKNGKYDIKINELESNERSMLGIFLATQYPPEIVGVNLSNYLRLIYNKRRKEKLPVFKFKKVLEEKAEIINYPKELLQRNLNEGFSGGEKKKTEILQMLLLEPRYVMLDEIDSGLDKQAVKEVFEALKKVHIENPQTSFIIITHYDKYAEYLKPDYIHEMQSGKIVQS